MKRGRPKTKRSKRFFPRTFGATDAMWQKIERWASDDGMPASEFIRKIVKWFETQYIEKGHSK